MSVADALQTLKLNDSQKQVAVGVDGSYIFIIPVALLGILYAQYNYNLIKRIQPLTGNLVQSEEQKKIDQLFYIGKLISEGASSFLYQEYKYLIFFVIIFSGIIYSCVDQAVAGPTSTFPFSTFAFFVGAITSILSGYVGMAIATYSNSRTAFMAINRLQDAFKVAYRAGCVMGFFLTSIGLLFLVILIIYYRSIFGTVANGNYSDLTAMMECVASYGLGGSCVALFGRVGGGIYTKAADVGADLVGKVEQNLPEDSPKNPATIADNVGDNVGDIAGMGSDLFGSFAESTAAALAIGATSLDFYGTEGGAPLMYPLHITAFGLIGCFLTSFFATKFMTVDDNSKIESTLKAQLIISSIILTPLLYGAAAISLPESFSLGEIAFNPVQRQPYHAFICTASGLWAGLIIGFYTEYMTSHSYQPVREVASSCQTGAATNVIFGLALGYQSTIVPVIAISACAYVSFKLLGTFGIALGALGMLSNLAISLAIDAYGPISDNAGGIAEMAELGEEVRDRTDALDAAGNTTAAVGKGFAIGSAALVSLSLYGAFLTRAIEIKTHDPSQHGLTSSSIQLMNPLVFTGLLVGAMLPFVFSAMTMKSVGKAAQQMVEEVRRQIKERPGILDGTQDPEYAQCIAISTQSSLKEMIPPALLVIVTPFLVGIFFGPKAVAGVLPGALISGVQQAISMSNTGGAWDNAKKYIEGGNMIINGEIQKKGTDIHKAAVIGDTVGDPLKDTSGPSLNILIKLMAILSLVFCSYFTRTGYFLCDLGEGIEINGITDCPLIPGLVAKAHH